MTRTRGVCPDCLRERRVKADRTMGGHRRIAANGYTRLGQCSGVDQPPLQAAP